MTKNNTVDSVYQIHKDKVQSGVSSDALTEIQYPQGSYTQQIIDYARTSIPEDEASRVRCATFRSLDNVCKFIAAKEDVPESKVYPALRYIGYNVRYHDMKCGKADNLYNLGDVVKQCVLTMHVPLIEFATDTNIFKDTRSVTYRMQKAVIAITMKDAEQYGIKVSELNLYNVLTGINTLVFNEADYILLRDERIFKMALTYFADVKSIIDYRFGGMKVALSRCD